MRVVIALALFSLSLPSLTAGIECTDGVTYFPCRAGPRCDAELGWPEGCPEECADYEQESSGLGYNPCWADVIGRYPAHAGLVNCKLYKGDFYEKTIGQSTVK
jgi:hypothetical protein